MIAMKQTAAEKRNAPLMLRSSSMEGNSLMERKRVMDLRTEVMEEAGPLMYNTNDPYLTSYLLT